MKNNKLHEALKKEQEKLNCLVDEALLNGTPISKTHDIMKQCKKISRMARGEGEAFLQDEEIQKQSRKVDRLIAHAEKEG